MNLTCSCCGSGCKGRQWHNRDKGFGLCPKCAGWIKSREKFYDHEEFRRCYGISGEHYKAEGSL